ncbi:MAG: hypothetical protein JNK52_12150 [Zoogloeaceae bacterium]|nr:hypothetical protein [Zoogloeaceae bacterium]
MTLASFFSDDAISRILDGILKTEGGYVDHPADRGGETKYGITVAVARANGYQGPMQALSADFAREIYRTRYIKAPNFSSVLVIDEAVGVELIDTGVNMGPHVAAGFLQRLLNGLNSQHRYADLFVDGRIGRQSLAALTTFLEWRGRDGRTALLRGLNGLQAVRYIELTERRHSQRQFLYGWLLNRVVMD